MHAPPSVRSPWIRANNNCAAVVPMTTGSCDTTEMAIRAASVKSSKPTNAVPSGSAARTPTATTSLLASTAVGGSGRANSSVTAAAACGSCRSPCRTTAGSAVMPAAASAAR